jgi:hypothetical protein
MRMIDPLRPFRTLAAAVRRLFSRRAARKLVAQQLPRGLLPSAPQPLRLSLRVPLALDDAPFGEFRTLPLFAHAIRGRRPSRLLRLAALPRPPRRLEVLRPRKLRLDSELRLPVEVDPLRLFSDAPPPVEERRVRPRTPLARAPVQRLRLRNFRLDPETGQPANEGIVPLEMRATAWRWVLPAFRREKVDLPWMAQERISFLGPLQYEWFLMWWDASQSRRPGAKEPYHYWLSEELDYALETVKEQMLIRRDVKKDENPPEEQEFYCIEMGHPIAAFDTPPLTELVPEKQWIGRALTLSPPPFTQAAREAYLQWRTLVDALEER